jgi:phosphatidate cytidylyltransferase|tara:strand:- start:35 stop:892 length:858 start_codon:yes stop_codon:yes gene_type:complete
MGPRVAEPALGTLRLRVISAAVLAPPAVALTLLGGWAFAVLVGLAGFLMVWEWDRLCSGGEGHGDRSGGFALVWQELVVLAAIALTALGRAPDATVVIAMGAVLSLVIVSNGDARRHWPALGIVYIGLPCIAIVWLRHSSGQATNLGLQTLIWILALVWATDSAAYAAGRLIGGPRLAPRLSPNKTWAGLAGAIIGAALVGALAGSILEHASLWFLIFLSGLLALVSQAGDIFESALKRHFDVKDSGTLIPGHGGILDRLDGLLFVALAVAVLTLLRRREVLAWL